MYQKNIFSYFMWFLYSMVVCVSLLGIGGTLSRQAGYPDAIGFGAGGLWLLFCGLIVFFVPRLIGKANVTNLFSRVPVLAVESLFVVSLLIVGIVLRMGGLFNAGDDASYYEMAKVTGTNTIPPVVHGAIYIYLQLLHSVYSMFSNNFLAGIWLQIILLVVAALFFYFAVRKLTGVLSALVVLGFIMVGSLMINETLSLSPEILFLAIYGLALFVSALCIRGMKKPIVVSLITGVLIAFVCYLDIMGVTLLLMTVTGLLLKKDGEITSLSKRLGAALLCILGSVSGFLLLMLVDSFASGKGILSIMAAWWEVFCPVTAEVPAMLEIANISKNMLVLLLIMTFGLFSYWRSFDKERQSIWILLACLLVLLQCLGMTTEELNGYIHLYIVFAVLAGAGLENILIPIENKEEELKETEAIEVSEEPKEAEEVGSSEIPKEADTLESSEEPKEPEVPKVKLIENPLPLPKKHVKKVLDYDIDVSENQDNFDLEVDDNDDFDI